jgi:outer membrane protein assembly factor BamB
MRLTLPLLFLSLTFTTSVRGDDWPSFRGPFARGVADDQSIPSTWNPESGDNVRWKQAIPGAGHGSVVVAGGKLYLITAVTDAEIGFALGDERGPMPKDTEQQFSWRLYKLDAATGEIDWAKEAYSGVPRANRHPKSSQANTTPAAAEGTVVAIFSQGLVAFDYAGNERWRKDLGVLDPGLFGDAGSQWGYASSPVIHQGRVFLQVDRHSGSFIAAYELETGEEIWRVERQEKPVWATPTIHVSDARQQLIVVGGDYDRGLDPATGEELWKFSRDLQVKTPTPFVADGLVVLAGGYRGQALHGVRADARGDVEGEELVWSSEKGGPYTSTPVAYGGRLFYVRDTGIFNVLDLRTGENLHRRRLNDTFSASPVASDGRVFFVSETGEVSVISAEPPFDVISQVDMGEPCMGTPAISDGTLFLRCRSQVWAIGDGEK